MGYLSVSEIAKKWHLSERAVRNYCALGRVSGEFLPVKTCIIRADAKTPTRVRALAYAPTTLLSVLQREKQSRLPGGIYHRVQIDLTYNSNHIEGSRLSREQTRFIFETNTIGIEKQAVNVDDVVETANHFRCIDLVIDDANRALSQAMIKRLHEILKSGTLGRVNLITMNFGSFKEYDMKNRFFNRSLAGGAMLDIGVYALSVIRWFFDSKPDNMLSQLKTAPTGVDEQASLLLSDKEGQMATVMLSLHSKQPKRAMISCENGYIEIMEYPRAWEAKITYTDGRTELVGAGENSDALYYEITDMEKAVNGDKNVMCLDYTADVMEIMTRFRQEHGIIYPEEE